VDTCKEFKQVSGRSYGMLETYAMDDAEDVIITTSTMAETASIAVDSLREERKKVGVLRIRYLRPFPAEKISELVKGKKRVVVLDRNISFGAQGIFCQEVRAAIYGRADMPEVYGYILGLGGRDVRPDKIINIYKELENNTSSGKRMFWGDIKL